MVNYWLDLFTGTTWDEFRKSGTKVSGFRERRRSWANRIQPGDILLCYLTGVMRWVGALEVVGFSKDKSKIWSEEDFPVRFDVRPLVVLDPETGIPMSQLKGLVEFYMTEADEGGFKGFLRGSPNLFKRKEDGEAVLTLLKQAEAKPIKRSVDPKKLARKSSVYYVKRKLGRKQIQTTVTIPETETLPETAQIQKDEGTTHTEIQWRLLSLGSSMGLQLWVANNDRSKTWNNQSLGSIKGILSELPNQFNPATQKTIELIDVLWLKGNSIIAAFEIEHTSSVYSGLLRMADLLALQPNLNIKLYLVAPDERRQKVEQEIMRPTFAFREKPLNKMCGFVPYSKLREYTEEIIRLGIASSIQPNFLDKIAEYVQEEE